MPSRHEHLGIRFHRQDGNRHPNFIIEIIHGLVTLNWAERMAATISLVVVLPFEPVTATTLGLILSK